MPAILHNHGAGLLAPAGASTTTGFYTNAAREHSTLPHLLPPDATIEPYNCAMCAAVRSGQLGALLCCCLQEDWIGHGLHHDLSMFYRLHADKLAAAGISYDDLAHVMGLVSNAGVNLVAL
jgi:hypothetical protein